MVDVLVVVVVTVLVVTEDVVTVVVVEEAVVVLVAGALQSSTIPVPLHIPDRVQCFLNSGGEPSVVA